MSIYTHPKIAALRKVEAHERDIQLAKAILAEKKGTIPASGRGQRDWAKKILKAVGQL